MARHLGPGGGMNVVLVGAGGHAKAVCEAIRANDGTIAAYVSPSAADWLDARHIADDAAAQPEWGNAVLGIGGVEPVALTRRLALLDRYLARSFGAVPVVHRAAHVSPAAVLEPGVVVLAGAIVQPGAVVGRGCIVNSGAIVEHDAVLGAGSHAAPGAIVLGNCRVGDCCMIGAGSVVLQGVTVAARTLIRAGSVYGVER